MANERSTVFLTFIKNNPRKQYAMSRASAKYIVDEFSTLSDVDQRRVYTRIKQVYEETHKREKPKPEGGQRILWKDILFDLFPNQYIRNYQEIWRLESILGSDKVREALREHRILSAELIEQLFKQYSYPFYVTQSEAYLFSNYGDISEANGGPLKETTPLDALQRYGLEKLEESIEKRYVGIQ